MAAVVAAGGTGVGVPDGGLDVLEAIRHICHQWCNPVRDCSVADEPD